MTRASELAPYFDDVSRYPLVSGDEERRLAILACGRDGDKAARATLTQANLRLVASIARKYQGKGLDLPDLIQLGSIGLMRGIDRFNPHRDPYIKLSTYASYWIKQSIRRSLIDQGLIVRVSTSTHQMMRKWQRMAGDMSGAAPADSDDVATAMGLSPRQVVLVEAAIRASATQRVSDASDSDRVPPVDEWAVARGAGPADRAEANDDTRRIMGLVGGLPERQAVAIRMRFGLTPYDRRHVLKEIGKALGVTRERGRQIVAEAMDTIREAIAS